MPSLISEARPVMLESRRLNGAWHQVAQFDASEPQDEVLMREAVLSLGLLDAHASFRVVTADALKVVLLTYSLKEGWQPQ